VKKYSRSREKKGKAISIQKEDYDLSVNPFFNSDLQPEEKMNEEEKQDWLPDDLIYESDGLGDLSETQNDNS